MHFGFETSTHKNGVKMFSADMLEERRKCITGTDISAIIGCNPWSSPLTVYCEKLGLSQPINDNPAMEWGRRLESIVAEKYYESNRIPLNKGYWIRDGIYGGTPDYFHHNKIVEIKTSGRVGNWGESGTDQVPEQYICQVQWYMMLKNYREADIAVLIAGNDYRVYHISYNSELVKYMTAEADKFWKTNVIAQIPPFVTSKNDNKVIANLYPDNNEEILERPSLDENAYTLRELKVKKEAIEDVIAYQEGIIKAAIADKAGVTGTQWKATWKQSKDSKKTDWQSVAKELQATSELIEKHTSVIKGSRRFLFNIKD